jgi:hypothetical protein
LCEDFDFSGVPPKQSNPPFTTPKPKPMN